MSGQLVEKLIVARCRRLFRIAIAKAVAVTLDTHTDKQQTGSQRSTPDSCITSSSEDCLLHAAQGSNRSSVQRLLP